MTTQGASGPLEATARIDAYRACLLSGAVRAMSMPPDAWDGPWREHLTQIQDGDWAAYKYLDFGDGVSDFHARAGSLAYGGTIEVHVDAPEGPLVSVCEVPHTGGWQRWIEVSSPVREQVNGVHAVYLVFKGGNHRLFDLDGFRFTL
jgi:hypothetical protein